MPQQIVEAARDAPRTEGVKEHARRIARFVRVILIEQSAQRMRWVHQLAQLRAQTFDLMIVEQFETGEVAVLLEESDLFRLQAVGSRSDPCLWQRKKIA